MAFLDDIHVGRVQRGLVQSLQNELLANSGIQIYGGDTRVWNSGGVRLPACDALERIARAADADENVWQDSQLPLHEQGIKRLGTPLGHPEFVLAHLDRITTEHRTFLERIPSVPDLQSAWSLCSSPSNIPLEQLRGVRKPIGVLPAPDNPLSGQVGRTVSP